MCLLCTAFIWSQLTADSKEPPAQAALHSNCDSTWQSTNVSGQVQEHNVLSLFILVINQLDAQNLFYNKFISCLYMFRASCAHRQKVKVVLQSLWYHQTCRWHEINLLYCIFRQITRTPNFFDTTFDVQIMCMTYFSIARMTLTSGTVRKYRLLLTEDTGVIPKNVPGQQQ